MRAFFILSVLFIFSFLKAEAHSGKTHVHGAGELAIAFEKTQGKVEFRSAAEAILGFEHEARTPEEKRALAEVREGFGKDIAQMVRLDSALQCHFETKRIDLISETKVESGPKEKGKHHHKNGGRHADFVAEFSLSCQKSPRGGSISVDFSRFKRLKNVEITILMDDLQKSARYQGQPVKVDLQ